MIFVFKIIILDTTSRALFLEPGSLRRHSGATALIGRQRNNVTANILVGFLHTSKA